MTTRVFLVQAHPLAPGIKAVQAMEVVEYDAATHRLVCRRMDGTQFVDPNFWPAIAKRVGFSLTTEVPQGFQ